MFFGDTSASSLLSSEDHVCCCLYHYCCLRLLCVFAVAAPLCLTLFSLSLFSPFSLVLLTHSCLSVCLLAQVIHLSRPYLTGSPVTWVSCCTLHVDHFRVTPYQINHSQKKKAHSCTALEIEEDVLYTCTCCRSLILRQLSFSCLSIISHAHVAALVVCRSLTVSLACSPSLSLSPSSSQSKRASPTQHNSPPSYAVSLLSARNVVWPSAPRVSVLSVICSMKPCLP